MCSVLSDDLVFHSRIAWETASLSCWEEVMVIELRAIGDQGWNAESPEVYLETPLKISLQRTPRASHSPQCS